MKKKSPNTTIQRALLAVLIIIMCLAASMTAMAAAGWRNENGQWHYYDDDGVMMTDIWRKLGADWFYMGPEGNIVTGEFVESYDSLYYTHPETGAMIQSAWWNIDGDLYYFDYSGKALRGCSKTIDGIRYTFDDEGRLVGGKATPSNGTVKRALESMNYTVRQEVANDTESCMAYAESYASSELIKAIPLQDSCSVLIKASPSNCRPAVEGTKSNEYGKSGEFTFYLTFTIKNEDSGDESSGTTKLLNMIIYSTHYTGGDDSGGDGSGGSDSSDSSDSSGSSGTSGSSGSSSSSVSPGRSSTTGAEQRYLQEVAKSYTVSGTWETADGKWKLKKSDGTYLANAWAYLDGKWYYMGEDAYMKAGLTTIGDQVFYLDPVTGEMKTGWQLLDGKWYYFSTDKQGSQGAMYKDTTTPDGYKVGADGVWIE